MPPKKAKYPLPFDERKRRLEQPTYEEQIEDDRRDEVIRNMTKNSR